MRITETNTTRETGMKITAGSVQKATEASAFASCLNERMLAKINGETKGRAPYSYLADESGIINYKGVIFQCDDEKNTITLGDMSNPKDVITIPLSEGGCLKVNRDNIGDLAKAIDMFSPEDINRILRALSKDAKAREKLEEIEETKEIASRL